MSVKCINCKCYSCINMCVCNACRNNADDVSSQELLDMEIDRCEEFEHLPVISAKACIGECTD